MHGSPGGTTTGVVMRRIRSVTVAALRLLPRGGDLPAAEFERRHAAMIAVLCGSSLLLAGYALTVQGSVLHALAAPLLPMGLAACGARRDLPRRMRAIAVVLGLNVVAALAVHLSGGVIEAHFAFFVAVVLLTLYEDWAVFGLAVAFVLVHHGVMGALRRMRSSTTPRSTTTRGGGRSCMPPSSPPPASPG